MTKRFVFADANTGETLGKVKIDGIDDKHWKKAMLELDAEEGFTFNGHNASHYFGLVLDEEQLRRLRAIQDNQQKKYKIIDMKPDYWRRQDVFVKTKENDLMIAERLNKEFEKGYIVKHVYDYQLYLMEKVT